MISVKSDDAFWEEFYWLGRHRRRPPVYKGAGATVPGGGQRLKNKIIKSKKQPLSVLDNLLFDNY